ncbi:hypothetical protein [Streptomyces indicus]|uniref:hypothetical protein n=1 Tax=Streptomyces indicus TaxID=417292 RepID=UPI000B843574|nr:hypothetical protein [Streptomyces indicus]
MAHTRYSLRPYAKLAGGAALAEHFGYEYADTWSGGQDGTYVQLVPDPTPQARLKAQATRSRYPDASSGGPIPAVDRAAVELLKIRMKFDLSRPDRVAATKSVAIGGGLAWAIGSAISALAGNSGAALALAALALLFPLMYGVSRHWTPRLNAQYARQLTAAGYLQVTDTQGRLRYMPGGRLPGHGNPYAPMS